MLRAQPMDERTFANQYRIARVFEETRDLTNALRLYTELHTARPDMAEISDGLFRCLYALKRYAEADTLLNQRLSREPETFDLYLNLARVRSRLNKKSESLDAFAHAEKLIKGMGSFSSSILIAQTMMDAGYQEETLAMLIRRRKTSEESDQFTREIAALYFKLGKYDDGTKEYLAMLHSNEQDLSYIEQGISRFTADSSVRRQIIKVVTSHIDIESASPAELRLLGWCYGELKNYKGALQIFLKLDNLGVKNSSASAGGYELYQFAERIRNEGALEVAVMAYNEAIKRFREGAGNDPRRKDFVSMAELGALKTKEAYFRSLPDSEWDSSGADSQSASPEKGGLRVRPTRVNPVSWHDSLDRLVSDYQNYAAAQLQNDLAFEALLHAGELSFRVLHTYPNAQYIYENILARSQSYSEKTRDAYFALEELALAQGDLLTAAIRLDNVSAIISKRKRPDDAETAKHILFERARIDYFNGSFDSSISKLDSIITDPNSDYANDAIALHSLITENTGNNPALKLFAKAELQSLGKDMNAALSAYRSIPETYPSATIADESVLRAVDILLHQKKPNDALAMLQNMQEKMMTSPLLDKAVFREAEIIEVTLRDKPKAQRMYEDFLERFPKSSLATEARKRARALRGDSF